MESVWNAGTEGMVARIGRDENRRGRPAVGVGLWFVTVAGMNRSTHPTEILLGFAAGLVVALVVEQPLVWFLHHLGVTARHAFSTQPTAPLAVEAVWSRVFWGGVFGIALAWFGTRYDLGGHWLGATIAFAAGVRTLLDWFVLPMFWGHVWVGLTADAILTPLIVNAVWAAATAALLAAMTIAAGTWGSESLT
jgi:hypothetical protein